MSNYGVPDAYEDAVEAFEGLTRDATHDALVWFSRLTDVERLMGLCGFILLLFVLVLVKATSRTAQPGHGRSFLSAFVLVVSFSFMSGLLIDSDLDWQRYLPSNFV